MEQREIFYRILFGGNHNHMLCISSLETYGMSNSFVILIFPLSVLDEMDESHSETVIDLYGNVTFVL
jgi:hypothetical protein